MEEGPGATLKSESVRSVPGMRAEWPGSPGEPGSRWRGLTLGDTGDTGRCRKSSFTGWVQGEVKGKERGRRLASCRGRAGEADTAEMSRVARDTGTDEVGNTGIKDT